MSKVVAHMAKMKAGNLSGIQKHNERLNNNYSNEMIDVSRSHLNYDLVKNSDLTYKEMIDKHIAENIVLKRALRKDAVLVNEWIISSEKKFFDKLNEQQTREYFQVAVDYFNEKCGNHVVYATVHLDENTPHMHLGVVPIVDGKLSSKKLFGRKMLREIQDELPERLKSKGFEIERGILGSEQKHLSVKEYKANKQAVKEMSEKINEMDRVKTHLEGHTNALKRKVDKYIEDVSKLNTEQIRVQNDILKQNKESETLEKKILKEKDKLKSVSDQVDEINHRVAVAWRDDWLLTKKDFPEFEMTVDLNRLSLVVPEKKTSKEKRQFNTDSLMVDKDITLSSLRNVSKPEIEQVDEVTPERHKFDFRSTLKLFGEKTKAIIAYIKEQALELENKAKELLKREKELDKRENELKQRESSLDDTLKAKQAELHKTELSIAEEKDVLKGLEESVVNRLWTLTEINHDYEPRHSELQNDLGEIIDNAREQRFGNGCVVDKRAINVMKQVEEHLKTTNPVTLIEANNALRRNYLSLSKKLETEKPITINVEVAKATIEKEKEINALKSEIAQGNKERQAFISIITDLAHSVDKQANAYEIHYELGKTLYEYDLNLSEHSRESIDERLLGNLSTEGFVDGYNNALAEFKKQEQERETRYSRVDTFDHDRDWGGMSL